MNHAKDAVALVHLIREIIAGLSEVHGEGLEDAPAEGVQRGVHGGGGCGEITLLDDDVGGHDALAAMTGR